MLINNTVPRKIKILKDISRESYYTSEPMSWRIGDLEVADVNLESMEAQVNWG